MSAKDLPTDNINNLPTEVFRRRILALERDGYSDDFLRNLRNAHKKLLHYDACLALLEKCDEYIRGRDHEFNCPRIRDDHDCNCGLSDLRADISETLAKVKS